MAQVKRQFQTLGEQLIAAEITLYGPDKALARAKALADEALRDIDPEQDDYLDRMDDWCEAWDHLMQVRDIVGGVL